MTRHLTSTEGTGRYQFWNAGWEAFKSDPLKGVGAAGYEPWWAQHGSLDYSVRNAHSLFIETAAELGCVGLCPAARLPRRRRSSRACAREGLAAARTGLGRRARSPCSAAGSPPPRWSGPGRSRAPSSLVIVAAAAGRAGARPRRPSREAREPAPGGGRGVVVRRPACCGGRDRAHERRQVAREPRGRRRRRLREGGGRGPRGRVDPAVGGGPAAPARADPGGAATRPAAKRASTRRSSAPPRTGASGCALTRLRASAGDRAGRSRALRRTRALAPPSPALTRVLLGRRQSRRVARDC